MRDRRMRLALASTLGTKTSVQAKSAEARARETRLLMGPSLSISLDLGVLPDPAAARSETRRVPPRASFA
jgi:hypothetical protein